MTTLRQAVTEGLHLAAQYVNRFGWEPAGPNVHLDIWSHLSVAAGKTGPKYGERPEDVQGVMSLLLERHLEITWIFGWEDEPERTAADVHHALSAAAGPAVDSPLAA
jgi:hypothetical protein